MRRSARREPGAFEPSKTVAQMRGGALSMAQRFFIANGTTPLTPIMFVCGGR